MQWPCPDDDYSGWLRPFRRGRQGHVIAWVAAASLFSVMLGLYASSFSLLGAVRDVCQLSLLGAARDVCQLLSDLAAAQCYCRSLYQSCGSIFWSHFVTILVSFWASGGIWRPPWGALGSLCATPAPRDPPGYDFRLILGRPWDPFWRLVGSRFRLRAHPGGS